METALHARDRVGVQDFVLLEEYRSVTAFVDNLKKRFLESIIYTYIGPVLISVNPYKVVNIYNDKVIATYKNVNIYELPPHIYAVADNAYRSMQFELRNQCMLISGESGAGKTEASKKILQFIAATTSPNTDVDLSKIRDRLLQSNPILEAFGNAKTNRNDNSSRFGKYMDIQFDIQGSPIGGVILSYLLEKSRVVHQAPGERNFHIFYQLVRGADRNLLTQLDLEDLVDSYFYLNQGDCEYMGGYTATIEEGISNLQFTDDEADFEVVRNALDICEFSDEEQMALFSIIAFILHLGNIGFLREQGVAVIANKTPIPYMAKLIGCPQEKIQTSLTNRSILVDGERVISPLNMDQAIYARDAFAKGLYERVFMWLVNKINSSLVADAELRKSDIGLLDIYGFEIFETNSFEQFCINYCNEKLQQLFLTLTLKQEQEEYLNEGIEWEPVQYFNNKVICDLVEKRQWGIIAIMDDTCLMPGVATDEALLDRMANELRGHQHFLSHSIAEYPEKKTIGRDEFRLLHYAGEVTYNIDGFLDKNNDLFYRDLKEALTSTTNLITSSCFKQAEIDDDKKRPDTAGTQFKNSLNELMDILAAKEPSYIRCIKPNDKKKPNLFDDQIVRHQVKYLGLMENLRVRRAGFAYRREFDQFLNRYKSMTSKTWPHFNGTAREGVEILVDHLEFEPDDYKLGKTKIFIRFPRLLFSIEDALHNRKHILAEVIQTRFRTYRQRKKFLQMRESATKISCTWKMYQAKQTLQRLRNAAQTTRKFMIGFIKRKQPLCEENRLFIGVMRYNFLMNIKNNLPKSLADKSWPEPTTPMLREASEHLRRLYIKNAVRKYCLSMSAKKKALFEEKVVAETLFKGKKDSYEKSVEKFFTTSKLDSQRDVTCNNKFATTTKPPNEKIVYSTLVAKYNRNGYSAGLRALVVTDSAVYILNDKDFKLKEKVLFAHLKGISVSSLSDGLFVMHLDSEIEQAKGDIILATDCMTEAVVKIVMAANKVDAVNICDSIIHQMPNGKQGLIEFTTGPSFGASKGKNGHLVVVCPPGDKPHTSKKDSKRDDSTEFSIKL